jgi:DNA mismatch endonuclease (patch repair protein)
MPDIFSKRKRSAVMAAIRSHGNKATELRLMAVFRAEGITGWRRGVVLREQGVGRKMQAGFRVRPDFVFRARRVAVFVDGCFWHGCPRHYRRPGSRRAFWDAKIARNRDRDRLVTRALRQAGWTVLRIWEHELATKNAARLRRRLAVVAF